MKTILRRLWLPLGLVAILSACATVPPAQSPSAFSTPAGASVLGPATATTITLYSPALQRETHYIAIRPTVLEPGRSYPVLYLLHGAYGSYDNWIKRTPLLKIHGGRPLIIITPDGSPFGWYVDSPYKKNSNYETFITRDLIADVDSRFPTIRNRDGRGIAGLSMGGHGSLSLAARHPDLYSSASSMSGILHLENHADPSPHAKAWHLDEILGPYDQNKKFWKEHSVYDLVDRFAHADVALLFDVGKQDRTGALTDGRQVDERLTNRAIVHTYHEFPGTHSWSYWRARIGEHIAFHLANFEARAKGTPPTTGEQIGTNKWHRHYVERTLAFEKENADKWERPGAPRPVVLLGSSSVEQMGLYKDFPDFIVANRGISADTIGVGSRGILHRLYCSVIDCHPRAVVILNGRNDLAGTARTGKPSMDQVVDTYHEVIRRIRKAVPDAPVVILGCFPTSKKYGYMAASVMVFDSRLSSIANQEGPMVKYIDTWRPFADTTGKLRGEFTRDGLHLNRQGHAVLRPIVVKALKSVGIEPEAAKHTPVPANR